MAHKRNEVNGVESKTGYTGKYFRYDLPTPEKNKVLEEHEQEKKAQREKPRKKKK